MRISDWSSDVCSSDLGPDRMPLLAEEVPEDGRASSRLEIRDADRLEAPVDLLVARAGLADARKIALDVGHHRGDAVSGEPLRQDLKRDGLAGACGAGDQPVAIRSEEHTSELQSLMRISYAVFCLQKKKIK